MPTKPWVYAIFVINLQSLWKKLRFLYLFEDVCNIKVDECNKQVVEVDQQLETCMTSDSTVWHSLEL